MYVYIYIQIYIGFAFRVHVRCIHFHGLLKRNGLQRVPSVNCVGSWTLGDYQKDSNPEAPNSPM